MDVLTFIERKILGDYPTLQFSLDISCNVVSIKPKVAIFYIIY